jgi:hypothetical protein
MKSGSGDIGTALPKGRSMKYDTDGNAETLEGTEAPGETVLVFFNMGNPDAVLSTWTTSFVTAV